MEFKDIEPYFKRVLKVLHSQDILYCNATDKQVAKALATVKTTKKSKTK